MTDLEELVNAFGYEAGRVLYRWAPERGLRLLRPRLLTNGKTDARVAVVYEQHERQPTRKLIVKVCPPDPDNDELREPGRHRLALELNPTFAEEHLVQFAYDPIPIGNGQWVLFLDLADGSLADIRTLSELLAAVIDGRQDSDAPCNADQLAALCGTVVRSVLDDWPVQHRADADVDVVTFLEWNLDGRLERDRSLNEWVRALAQNLLDPAQRTIWVPGMTDPLPNPLALITDPDLTMGRPVMALRGPGLGDLHEENVLIPIRPRLAADDFRLIDCAQFRADAPLSFDPVHLLLSIVARDLAELSASQQEAVLRFILDPDDDRWGSRLPSWLRTIITAVSSAGLESARMHGLVEEWREQTILSLLACALIFAGRRTTLDANRWWFLWMASEAGVAYLNLQERSASDLQRPRQTAGPFVAVPSPRPRISPPEPQQQSTADEQLFPEALPAAPPEGDQGPQTALQRRRKRTAKHRRPRVESTLARAADDLAGCVRDQWEDAATRRRLVNPGPIRVQWSQPRGAVAGPVYDALGGIGGTVPPLPCAEEPTVETLSRGKVSDLLEVYCGLPNGRLLILGRPGSGKTAAAIRLTLDVLRYRAGLNTAKRETVAVPVIFTPHSWDPASQPLREWLAQRLAADYPVLRSRRYGADMAARLVAKKLVALVLDGLDDAPEGMRSGILRALDEQARFRVVVLCRSAEMEAAAAQRPLGRSVAVELQPVEPSEAAAYLRRCFVDPPPPALQRLVNEIHASPTSPAAQALDSPLMLGLVRDTYRPS